MGHGGDACHCDLRAGTLERGAVADDQGSSWVIADSVPRLGEYVRRGRERAYAPVMELGSDTFNQRGRIRSGPQKRGEVGDLKRGIRRHNLGLTDRGQMLTHCREQPELPAHDASVA